MRSLAILLLAGIALLIITGVAVLHAQGVNASAGTNASAGISSNVSASGLITSYNVHLIIAQRWVTALNASGINSTAVLELINEAETYAKAGNYLEAIITLNTAINLAAQLMASAHINSTQAVLSNYSSLTSSVNSTVINNLLNNETIASLTLRVLSAANSSANAAYVIGMCTAILNSTKAQLQPYVPPRALLGLNTAINVLNNTYAELMMAGTNLTMRQLMVIKSELMIISLLIPPNLRAHLILHTVVKPYIEPLNLTVLEILNNLSTSLSVAMPTPQQLSQCMTQLNGTLTSLMNTSLGEPEAYAEANAFINDYLTCLEQVRTLVNESSTAHLIITKFMNVITELNNNGLANLTPYILNTYNQCRAELINAFGSGNTTLIRQVLTQCSTKAYYYEHSAHYAIWLMNSTKIYLSSINSTIWSLAKQNGISSTKPMLCYVRLSSNVLGNITLILKEMLNGTITPLEAQTLINEYLNSVINATPSLAAGCLGITTAPPHTYIPMIGSITAAPSASGELLISANGSVELTINITNPTQENLYITGLDIGGLRCTFSSAVEVNANSQGAIELGLSVNNGVITGVSSLSGSGGVVISQGTTLSCIGHSVITYMLTLSGRLYLSNGLWIPFFIMINGGTNALSNFSW